MSQSLATGAKLDAVTFADFVKRLRYDCNGPRVEDHCTANAIFLVERRKLVSGIDKDYTDDWLVYFNSGESQCFNPKEYWDQCDRHEKATLNKAMQAWEGCQFMKADESDQWHVLGELEDHTVTGYSWEWEFVCPHFTHAAAEAFIKRKKHDYREGLRIYVDSQYYSWEYEAIKAAILSGQLRYVEPIPVPTFDGYSEDIARELQAAFSQAITNAGLIALPAQEEKAA